MVPRALLKVGNGSGGSIKDVENTAGAISELMDFIDDRLKSGTDQDL
jgi:hypothetical protein